MLSHSCLQRGWTALLLECRDSLPSRSLEQTRPLQRVRSFISKAVRGTSLGFCSMIQGAKSPEKGQSLLPTPLSQHCGCPSILSSISHLSICCISKYSTRTDANRWQSLSAYFVPSTVLTGIHTFNPQFCDFRNYHNSHFTHKETLREIKSLS